MQSTGNSPSHGSVCRNWAFLGRCDYGDTCQFMHPRSSADGLTAFSLPPSVTGVPVPSGGSLLSVLSPSLRPSLSHTSALHTNSPGLARSSASIGHSNSNLPQPEEQSSQVFVANEFPVRKVHESYAAFTGVGPESSRSGFGQPEDRTLRWDLHAMRERALISARESQPQVLLPEVLQRKYHGLLLLDSKPLLPAPLASLPQPSQSLGYRTAVYKALSSSDAFVYCLRRIDGFRLSNFDLVQEAVAAWAKVSHPNIVGLRQAFASGEFIEVEGQGDGGSLVYVYDYIDLAYTLSVWHEMHEKVPVAETVLWDIAMQLLLAVREGHAHGLAFRVLHPSKILISPRMRVHVNCVGLLDAIQHPSISDSAVSIPEAQKSDLVMMGRILTALAVGGDISNCCETLVDSLPPGLSQSFRSLVKSLLAAEGSCALIVEKIGYMYSFKSEQMTTGQDRIMAELRKNLDTARLFQILAKINSIADRPGLLEDWRWAQTGERYIVGLFRDYLFFQGDEFGRPAVDFGHVTDALAKADVGSGESIMLTDRDGASVLVVSFIEIKRCIESSFKQILASQTSLH